MDTSDTSSDLTDSQWHDIGESYLTNSQAPLFNDLPDSEFLNKEKSDVHTD